MIASDDTPDRAGLLAQIGGRSFILCVGCGLVCSILLWFGKLSDGGFVTLIGGSVCAYVAKAAFQNRSEIRADVDKTKVNAIANLQPGAQDGNP